MARQIVKLRRGTKTEWQNYETSKQEESKPLEGELVVEYDNGTPRLKIGDGTTEYSKLPYIQTDSFVMPKYATVTIYPNKWIQDTDDKRWYQNVEIVNGDITPNSKVDLQPSVEQLTIFRELKLSFVAENNNGTVSVYCVGEVPSDEYSIQATVTEVLRPLNDKIIGDTTTGGSASSNISDNYNNFNIENSKNTVGIREELGNFECTSIDESTNTYTFNISDISKFESYTEYIVNIDEKEYLIRSKTINTTNVSFVAVNDPVPFVLNTNYSIIFQTKNAASFGVNNTVLGNEGFATGMANYIDETSDQGVANGYGNKLSGKAHFVAGSSNDVSEGQSNAVFGTNNVVKGRSKFVAGNNLLAEKTGNSGTVLGKWNEDTQDVLFILGNGYDKNHRKNALVIDNDANTSIAGNLSIDGDIYLKNNFSIDGLVKEVGEFECIEIQEYKEYIKYRFNTEGSTYIFQLENTNERNCKVTIDNVDYDLQILNAYYDYSKTDFVSNNKELLPLIVGNKYKIRIETKDKKSLSFVKNTKTHVMDMNLNGNISVDGFMTLNGFDVVNTKKLAQHLGIDIGKPGKGDSSVVFNSDSNSATGLQSFTAGAANSTTADQGVTFGWGNTNEGAASLIAGADNTIKSNTNGRYTRCIALGSNIEIDASYAYGLGTHLTINGSGQTVLGSYNAPDTTSVFIVGCGDYNHPNKNAITIRAVTGDTKFHENVVAEKTFHVYDEMISNGSITSKSDIKASGNVLGNNLFPKDVNFIINGNITNQDGTLVAMYDGTNVNFSLDKNIYPYKGRRIRDCQKLIIPIESITLCGIYKKEGNYFLDSNSDNQARFTDNGYYLEFIPEGAVGVTEIDDCYIINEPITINEVYLKTDVVLQEGDKYWSYDFLGYGLYTSIIQTSNLVAKTTGAIVEYKEPDGISTSLHLTSPNGSIFKLTVDDSGALTTIKL